MATKTVILSHEMRKSTPKEKKLTEKAKANVKADYEFEDQRIEREMKNRGYERVK
jgi:hypothetical protein